MSSSRTAYAVETEHVSRKYGQVPAVQSVSLRVPAGSVFGLLGVNGAGKSTLIKMLMGHLRPDSGTIRILGRGLDRDLLEIRRRVGYVSETQYVYEWMTVAESLRFTRAFHDTWDDEKAAALIERFRLPLDKQARALSRGNRARLCLALVLSYHPELIILDEPTAGLDPLVRRDFLEHIVTEISGEGRTVLFSSHIVEDIERVADTVGIIHEGRLVAMEATRRLQESFRVLRFPRDARIPDLSDMPGFLRVQRARDEQVVLLKGCHDGTMPLLQQRGVIHTELQPMPLEDIFIETIHAARQGQEA